MPRGRHRHSPPLHRVLPPSAIAGVSVVWALAPWVFTEPVVLRGLAAAAAATAVVGAVVMRRWDAQAGKQVADLTRARAGDEWRHEERVAELETDLDESRELRQKLEQRLRAKRAELAKLRNEHAALLRRYATAETERASVLEERRVLEIEAITPARALPPGAPAADGAVAAPAGEDTAAAEAAADAEALDEAGAVEPDGAAAAGGSESGEDAPAVFSPEGSRLFLRAQAALSRFDEDAQDAGDAQDGGDALHGEADENADETADAEADAPEADAPEAGEDQAEDSADDPADDSAPQDTATAADKDTDGTPDGGSPKDEPPHHVPPQGPSGRRSVKTGAGAPETARTAASETERAPEDDPQGKSGAAGHERAAATTPAGASAPAQPALPPARRPSGHFIAPTAVAVVPGTPVRRPSVEGGFDFFGTQKQAGPAALESVQNEDLADVVGEEALALHKAEAEAEFKPADDRSRGVGQVIDLTAHDETEHIDVQGLRSAVS
ncbi:hypothetical protein ACIPMW_05940 [Streptomyces sp. NPDC086669]|uniref:hypothetical protein n=1 Tax=Streptomyces sp. NPDC086669 TaxID=3365753 RepID=UPI00382B13E3